MPAADALAATIAATLAPEAARQEPSATIAPAGGAPTRRLARAAPQIRRLGYVEGDELGRGGLGRVLSATQQVFDRGVAIKRLLASGDHVAAMRFFAEALIAAQLEHPNIVPIHDLLADDSGALSLVMKRVEGRSWKALIASDPPRPLDDHLEILLKVCEAVEFAHSRGILHRDLKPENVMLGDFGEVAVMDWGCAVAFGEREQHPVVPRVEEIETISGTPSYLAPEMVLIEPNRIGPAADVYLLGAILYELLTGTRVHRGDSVYAVLRDAASGVVEPPRERAPDRAIPDELAQIALAALHADPAQRTASAAALAAQLRGYRRHAQAVALAEHARAQLAGAAKLDATRADAALRRAASAAENAVELWPDWQPGRALRAHATLAWAKHCLATGGFTQARALAAQAGEAARAADDDRAAHEAAALAKRAAAGEAKSHAHARNLRVARLGALAAAVLIAVVSVVGFVAVRAERQRVVVALADSERARAQIVAEQDARKRDQRRFAPGLLAQARAAIAAGDLAQASDDLDAAISFDAALVDAVALAPQVAAALGRYDVARAGIARWRALVPDAAAAGELDALCAAAGTIDGAVLATRIAEFSMNHDQPLLAQRDLVSAQQRLHAYRMRIDQAWPGEGDHLQMDDAGTLAFEHFHGPWGHRDCVSIEALRGMPFRELDLQDTQVEDLSPLRGMPLTGLKIDGTLVRDLSPLRGSPLVWLNASHCLRLDASTLIGLHLRSVVLNDATPVSDLAPLAGMPLENVVLGGDFTDLAPLASAPVKSALVGSSRPIALATLTSIESLELWNARVADADRLGSLRPRRLKLTWCGAMPDLRAVDGSRCVELELIATAFDAALLPRGTRLEKLVLGWGCRDLALAPLKSHPLRRLETSHVEASAWAAIADLRETPLEAVRVEGSDYDAELFWRMYRPDAPNGLFMSEQTDSAEPLAASAPASTPELGLRCEVVPSVGSSVQEIAHLPVRATSVVKEPSIAPLNGATNTGLRFSGVITVPVTSRYTFTLTADDGARLLIDDLLVVDNDGCHPATAHIGRAHLAAGPHHVTLLYFQGTGGAELHLDVAAPGEAAHPVPTEWWSH